MRTLAFLLLVGVCLGQVDLQFSTKLPNSMRTVQVFSNVKGFQPSPKPGDMNEDKEDYYDLCGFDCRTVAVDRGDYLKAPTSGNFNPSYADITERAKNVGGRPDRFCKTTVSGVCTQYAWLNKGVEQTWYWGPYCHQNCAKVKSTPSGTPIEGFGTANVGLFNKKVTSDYQVRWGEPFAANGMSGFGWIPKHNEYVPFNEEFPLGTMIHYNEPVYNPATGFTLTLVLRIYTKGSDPDASTPLVTQTYSWAFNVDETPNELRQKACQGDPKAVGVTQWCPYVSKYTKTDPLWNCAAAPNNFPKCPDNITFSEDIKTGVSFTINGVKYTLVLLGFKYQDPVTKTWSTQNFFLSEEEGTTQQVLYGIITLECPNCTAGSTAFFNDTSKRCECKCADPPCPVGLIKSADCSTCICPPTGCPAGATAVLNAGQCACNCSTIPCPDRQKYVGSTIIQKGGACGTCQCDSTLCGTGYATGATCGCVCDVTKCPGVSTNATFASDWVQDPNNCNCTCKTTTCAANQVKDSICGCDCKWSKCPETQPQVSSFVMNNRTCACTCDTTALAAKCAALGRGYTVAAYDSNTNTGSCECKPCPPGFTDNGLNTACVCSKTDAECKAINPTFVLLKTATQCECGCDNTLFQATCNNWNDIKGSNCTCTKCPDTASCKSQCDKFLADSVCDAQNKTKINDGVTCSCGPCKPNFTLQNAQCQCAKTPAGCVPPTFNATTSTTSFVIDDATCTCKCPTGVTCGFNQTYDSSICGCRPPTQKECIDVLGMDAKCKALNRDLIASATQCGCQNCAGEWVDPNSPPDTTKSCICNISDTYCSGKYGVNINGNLTTLFAKANTTSCECYCPAFSCPAGQCASSELVQGCGCDSQPCLVKCPNDNPTNVSTTCASLNREAIFNRTYCDCGPCIGNFTVDPVDGTKCSCPLSQQKCGLCAFDANTCTCADYTPPLCQINNTHVRDENQRCGCRPCNSVTECTTLCDAVTCKAGEEKIFDPLVPVCKCQPCSKTAAICSNNGANKQTFDPVACTCSCPANASSTCLWNQVWNASSCSCDPCVGQQCVDQCVAFNQTYCNSLQRGFAVNTSFCGCTDCLGAFSDATPITPLGPNEACTCQLACVSPQVRTPGAVCACECDITKVSCPNCNQNADQLVCGCVNDTSSKCYCGNGIVDVWAGEQCDDKANPCCNPQTCMWSNISTTCSSDPCKKPGQCAAFGASVTCNQTENVCDATQQNGCSTFTQCVVNNGQAECKYTNANNNTACEGGLGLCTEWCVDGACVPRNAQPDGNGGFNKLSLDCAGAFPACTAPCCRSVCSPATGQCEINWQVNATCDDLQVCTAGDSCKPNPDTTSATVLTCQGNVQCTDASNSQGVEERECFNITCDQAGRCRSTVTTGASCDAICTVNGTCTPLGACVGPKVDCPNDDECIYAYCQTRPGTANYGQCHNSTSAKNGMICDDGNNCTEGDRCINATCVPGRDACEENASAPIWPLGVGVGAAAAAAAIAAAAVLAKTQSSAVANPLTWAVSEGQVFADNPIFQNNVQMGDSALYNPNMQ